MECPICLTDTSHKINVMTPCKHVMCLECLMQLKKDECPMCRTELEIPRPAQDDPRITFPEMARTVRLVSRVMGELETTQTLARPRILAPLVITTSTENNDDDADYSA